MIDGSTDNLPYEKVGNNEPMCIADEVAFDIPDSWEWVRLKNITIKDIKRGKSPKYADNGCAYVFAQKCNVKLGGIDISLAKFLDMSALEKYPVEEYMIDEDIIINSTGNGTLGRIGMFHDSDRINDYIIVPDSHVTIIRASIQLNKNYLFYVLKYYQPYLEKLGEGSTNQTELRPSTVAELFIPVPPIKEQERIAEKLLEIFPMVDDYGATERILEKYNTDFPAKLKKSILQEAVQGKLVPQDSSDEPASILLERIRAEKERLVKEGKIKKDKHESFIFRRDNSYYEKCGNEEICLDEEIPFEIPQNWSWTRAFSLGTMIRGKGIKRTETVASGAPCIRYGEIYTSYNVSFTKAISYIPSTLDEVCPHLSSGDVVFTLTGENKVDIAKAVAFMGENQIAAGGDLAFWTAHGMNPLYLVYYMSSPYCIEQKRRTATGDIIVHISTAKVGNFLIPVPPLNEQKRIVSAIESFYAIIATL